MKRSRPTCSAFLLLILVAAGIIGLGLGFNYFNTIPAEAESLFGPASNRLSTSQYYLLSYRLVSKQDQLLTPMGATNQEVEFTINQDEQVGSILQRLESNGLIPDQDLVRNYLVFSGLDTQIQSGSFILNRSSSPVEIITALLDPTPRDVTFVILPGWRLEEIAASLPSSGLEITAEQLIDAAWKRGYSFAVMQEIPAGVNLEGFFPPGSYQIERALGAEDLVGFMLMEFDRMLPHDVRNGIEQQGLTLHQGVVLASIVEKEAILKEEMPTIASVFLNRLAIGMKLETDPTVQYAIGYNPTQGTWWTGPLSLNDLTIDSPYNTYLYPGLPPTPIANPSLDALRAVAFPAVTPFYYFRAACDGSGRHNFSQTFEEHLAFACQ